MDHDSGTPLTLAPDDPRLAFRGLAELVAEPDGWHRPWRIAPDRLRAALAPQELMELAAMPAGATVAVRTDAEALSADIDAEAGCAPIDVLVDGRLTHRTALAAGPAALYFALPGRPCDVQVWLPHRGRIRLRSLALHGGALAQAPAAAPRWTVYGSSITHCTSAAGPTETWPARVALRHGWALTCLGLNGEAHLDPVVARAAAAAPADLITACLGANVHSKASYSARTLPGAVAEFIGTVRAAA